MGDRTAILREFKSKCEWGTGSSLDRSGHGGAWGEHQHECQFRYALACKLFSELYVLEDAHMVATARRVANRTFSVSGRRDPVRVLAIDTTGAVQAMLSTEHAALVFKDIGQMLNKGSTDGFDSRKSITDVSKPGKLFAVYNAMRTAVPFQDKSDHRIEVLMVLFLSRYMRHESLVVATWCTTRKLAMEGGCNSSVLVADSVESSIRVLTSLLNEVTRALIEMCMVQTIHDEPWFGNLVNRLHKTLVPGKVRSSTSVQSFQDIVRGSVDSVFEAEAEGLLGGGLGVKKMFEAARKEPDRFGALASLGEFVRKPSCA
jgi:hypothetical protein